MRRTRAGGRAGTAARGRGRRPRRRPGRRTRAGRSPRGGRGSGACGRSRAAPRAARARRAAPRTSNHVTASRGVVGVERVPRPVAPVAADRRLDPPRARAWPSADEREVAPLDAPLPDRLRTAARAPRPSGRRRAAPTCRGRAGGRSPAAPGRRPRPRAPSSPCTRVARSVGPGGMDDEAGGLVDHEQVLVLVDDLEPQLDGNELSLGSGARRRAPPRPASRWLFGRRSPSTRTAPARHEPLGERARVPTPGSVGDDGVEPPARVGLRNARAVSVPTAALDRSAATNDRNSSPTPTTMNVSARLNAGQ